MNDQEYPENATGLMDEVCITGILEEYHRRQLLENLTGPTLSLLVHLVVLTLLFAYVVSRPTEKFLTIEVTIRRDDPKPFEPDPPPIDVPDTKVTDSDVAPIPNVFDSPSTDPDMDKNPVDISDEVPQTNDQMDSIDISNVEHFNRLLLLPAPYGSRDAGRRNDNITRHRAPPEGQRALLKALAWLASVQNSDGSWGTKYQAAHTGSALLVFLAYGQTPLSERYGLTVQKAMKWLAHKSMEGPMGREYEHGIATYALAEAYGMTGIPLMRTAMEQAIDKIIYGQQDKGGFDYGYKKGARWDMSVSVWQYQALKAAFVAGASNDGLDKALHKSVSFLKTTAYSAPGFSYASNRGGVQANLTGAGAVALQLLGESNTSQVRSALDYVYTKRLPDYQKVLIHPDTWDEIAGGSMYGWYYDTQAMFNAHVENAEAQKRWEDWKKTFDDALVKHQQAEGYWEVGKGHGMGRDLNGRILATCWSALQLTVYFRYLPTFDIEKMDRHPLTSVSTRLEDLGLAGGVL